MYQRNVNKCGIKLNIVSKTFKLLQIKSRINSDDKVRLA